MTMAKVTNVPLRIETIRFGKMTRYMIVNQPQPRLCAASVSTRTFIDCKPVSIERYIYGSDSIRYAPSRIT